MIDLEAIRARNEERKIEGILGPTVDPLTADIDALLAEVERLTKDHGQCFDCAEFHETHPTREGTIGWSGHACRCASCLLAESSK